LIQLEEVSKLKEKRIIEEQQKQEKIGQIFREKLNIRDFSRKSMEKKKREMLCLSMKSIKRSNVLIPLYYHV